MFIEQLTPDTIPTFFGKIVFGRITKSIIKTTNTCKVIEITAENCPPHGHTITFCFSDHGLVNMKALGESVLDTCDDFAMQKSHPQATIITKVYMREMQNLNPQYFYHEANFRRDRLDGLVAIREQNIALKNQLMKRIKKQEELMDNLVGKAFEQALDKHISMNKLLNTLSELTDYQCEEIYYNYDMLDFCFNESGLEIAELEELYPNMTHPLKDKHPLDTSNGGYTKLPSADEYEDPDLRYVEEFPDYFPEIKDDDEEEEMQLMLESRLSDLVEDLDETTPNEFLTKLGDIFEDVTGIDLNSILREDSNDEDDDDDENHI